MTFDPSQFHRSRVGMAGTGFMAKGIAHVVNAAGMQMGPALTRRPLDSPFRFPVAMDFTNEAEELVEKSDLVIECSGDPIHATEVVNLAMQAGKPVVTLNCEFHILTGSWFVDQGILTEGEGDQPGCLAALRQEVTAMGFEPLVYGNVKGFLNHHPSLEDMEYYSAKQGTSIEQTTSFTDGTKLQMEQAFVANAFDSDIYRPGLLGPSADTVTEGAVSLAGVAELHGSAIADYTIVPGSPAVFIAARHDGFHRPYLSYMKMGDGPFYTLTKEYHLCHLEMIKTIRNVLQHGEDGILMNNTAMPRISVGAIAKHDLKSGDQIERGIGSFDVRGEAVEIAAEPDHAPVGLLSGARLVRNVSRGQRLSLDDVDIPSSLARDIYLKLVDRSVNNATAAA